MGEMDEAQEDGFSRWVARKGSSVRRGMVSAMEAMNEGSAIRIGSERAMPPWAAGRRVWAKVPEEGGDAVMEPRRRWRAV